ncbi:amidohydrolase family protein [Planococcus sp. ISL-110]|uniref:metal-dependent hydrolase family protein n=1 Tax=Planococcus sp. ISL-110 TaxID=2819167 RepID=UPI001BE8F618|nr:amidohydrolase family protein [Planococcus sp. ISL-110]MBT2571320.1 amidohydrolase family protein [Planococcus sp. ISL-110]
MRKVLRNCQIIDGIVKDIMTNAYIIVENEKIIDMGTGEPSINDRDEVVDCEGGYVLPGLIDAHVHLVWDGSEDPQNVIQHLDQEMISLHAYSHAQETLQLGITTVRDVASPRRSVLNLRNAINDKVLVGPTILSSGPAICMTGGHVHYLGREADGPDEIRKAVREVMKSGADLVKLMATGGIYTLGEEPGSVQLSIDELQAAVEEAHKKNKKVAAHAEGLQGILNCLEVGVDTIEHGIYANEEALQKMVEKGTYLVPTMIVMKRLAVDDRIPEWALEKARQVVGPHQQMLENAIRLGVKIATGTDCGSPATPPAYYFDELLIMEGAGMSAIDVIHASTRVAAECLGLTDRGVLAVGNKADLLIVENNPLTNLKILKEDKKVMKNGEFVGSAKLQVNKEIIKS